MRLNYKRICQDLLKSLKPKTKEIIVRRFALDWLGSPRVKGETLESIGNSFGITRERVRQIENAGLLKIKEKAKKYQEVFSFFERKFQEYGGIKKEDILLAELSREKFHNQIYFLLSIGEGFNRIRESENFYTFWMTSQKSLQSAQKVINIVYKNLKKNKNPLSVTQIRDLFSLPSSYLISYLEISKNIQRNQEGVFGLKEWPEFNPRGVKDKAYLVFKKKKKPLHFAEVAQLIGNALTQTVHNELIKDERFVLVGRGIYALREWGYESGQVKDIIIKILKKAKRPLTREEILKEVLKQRIVKETTVLLNLGNRKYFLRTPQGRYQIKGTEEC